MRRTGRDRIEPADTRAGKQNASRLRGVLSGAGNEARTRDLNLGKVALYQLSYSRTNFWRRDPESNWTRRICNPLHNRFAIAPWYCTHETTVPTVDSDKKGKRELPLFVNPGAGNEARTRDLNLGKVALYQLSYSRRSLHSDSASSAFASEVLSFC